MGKISSGWSRYTYQCTTVVLSVSIVHDVKLCQSFSTDQDSIPHPMASPGMGGNHSPGTTSHKSDRSLSDCTGTFSLARSQSADVQLSPICAWVCMLGQPVHVQVLPKSAQLESSRREWHPVSARAATCLPRRPRLDLAGMSAAMSAAGDPSLAL